MPTNARAASATGVFGGGTQAAVAKRSRSWQISPLLALAETMLVDQGYTSRRTSHLADIGASNVATLAENSASISVTALPTITSVTATLISIYLSVAKSSESDLAQFPEHAARLEAMVRAMVKEALLDYVAFNGTNGLAQLISTLTAVGTSNIPLVTTTLRSAVQSLSLAGGSQQRFALVTDIIGFGQVKNDIEASTGGAWASAGLNDVIRRLLGEGAAPDQAGFTGFSYDQVDFWLVNGSGVTELYNDGTDTYDLLTAYPSADQSIDAVQSALVLAGRAMPSTRRDAMLEGTINNMIGIATWEAPLLEDSTQDVFKVTFDDWVGNTNRARAVRRRQS